MFYVLVKGFICLSPPSKLKFSVIFCFIHKKVNFDQCYSFISDLHPMTDADLWHVTE